MSAPDVQRLIPATLDLLYDWYGPIQYGTHGSDGTLVGVRGDKAGDHTVFVASPILIIKEQRMATCSLDPMRPEVRDHLIRILRLPGWLRDGDGLERWQSAGLIACAAAGRVPVDLLRPRIRVGQGLLVDHVSPVFVRRGVNGDGSWNVVTDGGDDASQFLDADIAALARGLALIDGTALVLPWPGGPRTWSRPLRPGETT